MAASNEPAVSKSRNWLAMAILAAGWPSLGLLVYFIASKIGHASYSKLSVSIMGIGINLLGAFLVFPFGYKEPFAPKDLKEYFRRLGFEPPRRFALHLLLGAACAVLALGAMFGASMLTGRYAFDPSTIDAGQTALALNAGIFEEFFYRGVMMAVLLKRFRSMKVAISAQALAFGLAHLKGFGAASLFDAFFVVFLALAFTAVAAFSGSLWAGMAFHVLYDAFLFAVQPPKGEFLGLRENALFYCLLAAALALASFLAFLASRTKALRVERGLYTA
jgi:membrane protease YdiL (CAAX protease family)